MNTMPYQQPMMTGARTMPMTGAMPGAYQTGYGAGAGYPPATGMMGAQPGFGGAYPPMGARPGFGGAYPPMGARPGYAAASPTGFGHGAFGPIRPVLSSIRRSNTTLQHTASSKIRTQVNGVGAYPGAGAYPRGATYPRTGAYGAYSNPRTATQTGMYAYPPKHKKYTMSTTFTYALLIVTPFLIICSFCMGKFVGGKGSGGVTPGAVITTNPDLMQPIH